MKQCFQDFKKKVLDFCEPTCTTWSSRIIIDSYFDNQYCELVNNSIDLLNNDISSLKLNSLLDQLFSLSKNASLRFVKGDSIKEQFASYIEVERYYGFIESIVELSSFSDNIEKSLKEKYKEGYLDILSEIDQKYLSYYRTSNLIDKFNDEEELIKKYLILKKFQDIQHIFCLEVLDGKCDGIEDKYLEHFNNKYPNIYLPIRVKYLVEPLLDKGLINIEDIAFLKEVNYDDAIIKLYGGKVYGLVNLHLVGANIPITYCLPYLRDVTTNDLSELDKSITYAVRSSADIEDGKEFSFAGMFDSYLDVDFNDIINKVHLVKESIHSRRVKEYIKNNKLANPNMGVIIQQYIDPDYALVYFSKNKKEGLLEFVQGSGEKLVSGKSNTTSLNISSNSDDRIHQELFKINNKLDGEGDFELAVKDDTLYFLQYRKVTKPIDNLKVKGELKGVSPGVVEGDICFIDDPSEVSKFKEGSILLTYYTDPEWMSIISKSKGLITLVGSFLCHSAIIAREYNIPCITSLSEELFNKLKEGPRVIMNGTKGEIEIL